MVAGQADRKHPEKSQHEVGSDWEDAFQAEDFLISSDTSSQSRLEERTAATPEKTEVTQSGPSKVAEGRGAGQSSAVGRVKKRGSRSTLSLYLLEPLGNNPLWTLLLRLPGGVGRGISRLAPSTRGIALLLSLIILGGFGTTFYLTRGKTQEDEKKIAFQQKAAGQEEVRPSVSNASKDHIAGVPSVGESTAGLPQTSESPTELSGPDLHKWRFSSFMINAGSEEAGKPNYVVIDLSLVLRLKQDEDIPVDKEYAVRDMIFQFFNNRPPYELRRFALARGEMKQKLLAWLNKEWPGNPIESILFNRYQLI